MRYLHELSEKNPSLYLKGEFEIIAGARSELEFLITLPELARVFTLTKMMYYDFPVNDKYGNVISTDATGWCFSGYLSDSEIEALLIQRFNDPDYEGVLNLIAYQVYQDSHAFTLEEIGL